MKKKCYDPVRRPFLIACLSSWVKYMNEAYRQYSWGYSVPLRRSSVPARETSFIFHSNSPSQILNILAGADDIQWSSSRVLLISLMGTDDMPHGYWWSSLLVLRVLIGIADMHHRYWWSSPWVLMIFLTGTEYPQGYCISLRVLKIVYTDWFSDWDIKLRYSFLVCWIKLYDFVRFLIIAVHICVLLNMCLQSQTIIMGHLSIAFQISQIFTWTLLDYALFFSIVRYSFVSIINYRRFARFFEILTDTLHFIS